jgi:DNA recombination protein RmuC
LACYNRSMNQNVLIFLIFIIAGGFAAIILFINKKFADIGTGKGDANMELVKQISDRLDRSMAESQRSMQNQFDSTTKIVKDVTEKLTKLEDTNQQVLSISDQLEGLERILKNPKQRGILGEYYLETLLKNLFQPNQYQTQYTFKDGLIADAVIFLKDKSESHSIIPIDSKFSLENYNKIIEEKDPTKKEQLEKIFKQDLKNRIDETAKYIKPSEGTMDFAFMFIPSEGIYYDLLVNQVGALKVNTRDLIDYAFKDKKVIIVSPTSFAAYLQTVLQGLKALSIEKSVKEIVDNVGKLGAHLNAYEQYYQKLGNNLKTTVGAYNDGYKELGKIDKDITKISGESIDVDVLKIEKPGDED